jgi:hypothetical protein
MDTTSDDRRTDMAQDTQTPLSWCTDGDDARPRHGTYRDESDRRDPVVRLAPR